MPHSRVFKVYDAKTDKWNVVAFEKIKTGDKFAVWDD